MEISIIGTGYVGLVAGACFASKGHRVTCIDIDSEKIAGLQLGLVPIYEPGLDELVQEGLSRGTLHFTDDMAAGLNGTDIAFVAVGTPPNSDGSSNLTGVFAVADIIGAMANGPTVVAIKSTVPVGVADQVRARLAAQSDRAFSVMNNPEFMREGKAVEDFLYPHRVVIGTAGPSPDREKLISLYESFAPRERILVVDSRSAELAKYAANAFLATKVSFMNEIAGFAEALGGDVELVRKVIGMDPRIGAGYLAPGIGYGGSCLPKDVSSLLHLAASAKIPSGVLQGVQATNSLQPRRLVEKVAAHFGGSLAGIRVAVWGVAFKPGTDDIREAPSLVVMDLLSKAGAEVTVFDPAANGRARAAMNGRVSYAQDQYECLRAADALIIATEWEQFQQPDWAHMRRVMRQQVIFDGRNMHHPEEVAARGFTYHSVGRGAELSETARVAAEV